MSNLFCDHFGCCWRVHENALHLIIFTFLQCLTWSRKRKDKSHDQERDLIYIKVELNAKLMDIATAK